MATPWMKFYPSDWRADPMLRLCSMAARGLWVEMLCVMHEATPYGSLLVNGRRLDKKQLAALVGIPEKDCTALLMELEGGGVFSRDEDGTIYSRRMRRDCEKSEEGRKQIGKRWGGPNRSPNRSPIEESAPEPNTQKPEARYQKPEKKEPREGALDDGWPADFRILFWNDWPHKVGKPKAMNELERLRRRGVPWLAIYEGEHRYIRTKPPDRPWLNPATFLHQERFNDQPAEVANGKSESLASVAKRQADAGISFGPRPTGLRLVEGGNDVRMLPEAGRERPGDLRGGGDRDPVGIPGLGDRDGNRSTHGPAEQNQMASDSRGGED